jgi:hypothetical protein
MAEEKSSPNQEQPAQPSTESGGWGWGGFFSNLSTQAASLVEEYVSDIKEFGSTISHDTSAAIESVAHRVESAASNATTDGVAAPLANIKSGVTSFVSGMSEMAQGVVQELGEIQIPSASPSEASTGLSTAQLQEKLSSADEIAFQQWMASFDVESKKGEISQLLAHNSSVLSLFQQLVPNDLSHEEFWGRYFFKLDQAAKKEEQRAAILSKTKLMASKLSEPEFSWDDDDSEEKTELQSPEKSQTPIPSDTPSDTSAIPISSQIGAQTTGDEMPNDREGVTPSSEEITSPVISSGDNASPEPIPITEESKVTEILDESKKEPVAEEDDVFEWN